MTTEQPLANKLADFRKTAETVKDVILTHLMMVGEIPAPSGEEAARAQFFVQRLSEFGLTSCSTDEMNNGYGIISGKKATRNILVVANADTIVRDISDQTVEIGQDRIVGPFVGDNSLGLTVLLSLPILIDRLGLAFDANIILMAASRSLGRYHHEGLRFFLKNSTLPIHAGIVAEGVQLGRLNHFCIGLLRGEIVCRLPDDYQWDQFGATGSILPMNDAINLISRIPLPRRPQTNIVLGSIHGGLSHRNIARETTLCFEVRCESVELLSQIRQQLEDIVETVKAKSGVDVRLDIVAEHKPGGIDIAHPFVREAKSVLNALGIPPMVYATTSGLAVMIEEKIPGLTLGLTTGKRRKELDEIDEAVDIKPIFSGMAQFLALLLAMDQEK